MLRDVRPSPAELEIVGNVACSICGKRLRNSGVLNVHLRTHGAALPKTSPVTNVRYFCPVRSCSRYSKPYTRLAQLKEHYGSCHAPKLFKCSRCGKAFGMISAGRRHEVNCGVKYKCDCGKLFESVDSRNKHAKKAGHSHSNVTSRSVIHPTKGTNGCAKRSSKRKLTASDGSSERQFPPYFLGAVMHGYGSTLSPPSPRDLQSVVSSPVTHTRDSSLDMHESSCIPMMSNHSAASERILAPSSCMVHSAAQTSMVGDELESATSLIALTYAAEAFRPQVTLTATASQTMICLDTDFSDPTEVCLQPTVEQGLRKRSLSGNGPQNSRSKNSGREVDMAFSHLDESTPSPPKAPTEAVVRMSHKALPVEGT